MGHGTMLKPKVEISPWLLLKRVFNTSYICKVGLKTKAVLYTCDWSVLKDLF